MVMTGSDLCASAKPWDLQLETVAVIYEEFYIQVGLRDIAGCRYENHEWTAFVPDLEILYCPYRENSQLS